MSQKTDIKTCEQVTSHSQYFLTKTPWMALSESPKVFYDLFNFVLDGRNNENKTYLLIYEI